jgi:hypothetical protein
MNESVEGSLASVAPFAALRIIFCEICVIQLNKWVF